MKQLKLNTNAYVFIIGSQALMILLLIFTTTDLKLTLAGLSLVYAIFCVMIPNVKWVREIFTQATHSEDEDVIGAFYIRAFGFVSVTIFLVWFCFN